MNYIYDLAVLTGNQKKIIKNFVKSFLECIFPPTRLIIIDDGSSDGTADYLKSLKDAENCEFQIVLNKENRRYLGGMNRGIELSDAPYVCLANNDLAFTPGWLGEISEFL